MNRGAIIVALTALFLVTSAAGAPAASHGLPPGQIECKEHTEHCGKKPKRVRDVDVRDGESKGFEDGVFVLEGNVTVHRGGTFTVSNATVLVADASVGFRALAGGVLVFDDALVRPTATSTAARFAVRAEAGATLDFLASTLQGGTGLRVAADDALVQGSSLVGIPLALATNGSDVVVRASTFSGHDVAIRFEGGAPTLEGSTLLGGTTCVHDYRTNPTIVGNVLRGCHTGILHVESHSRIADNAMSDDGEPPGSAIRVLGFSNALDAAGEPAGVVIERNTMRDFHSGVVVEGGRAFVRNNTISESVLAGVRITDNVGSLDVRGNAIRANGGDGIALEDASNVTIEDNIVEGNGGSGLAATRAAFLVARRNTWGTGGGDGVHVESAAGAVFSENNASGNAGAGFRFASSPGLLAEDLVASENGEGVVLSTDAAAVLRRVHAIANEGHGLRFLVSSAVGDVEIDSPRAISNGGDGLRNEGASGVVVENGWFESNAGFGARALSLDAPVLAPLAWWGSATGPAHALNPLGTGDEASDGVVYLPFATAAPS